MPKTTHARNRQEALAEAPRYRGIYLLTHYLHLSV